MKKIWLLALMLALNCQADSVTPNSLPIPGNSIYQLTAKFTNQDGHVFTLAEQRGKPVIISMFYNSCQFVCPMLIDTIQATQDSLNAEQRARVSVILVTFDPGRDSVAVLKSIAGKRHLDPAQWTLARTDATVVRKLAALLGIQYKQLENGDYNHSTVLVLLDGQGRILGSTSQIGEVSPEFKKLVQQAAGLK